MQGRRVSELEVALIGHWLQAFAFWNRTRLSRQLCEHWNWRNQAGRLKDMACRSLLLKLERRGLITLPPRRTASVNGLRNRQPPEVECQTLPVACGLAELQPLQVIPVENQQDAALFRFLLARHHYLGYGNTVGENVKYLVRAEDGRPLAALLFGAAAWKCATRGLAGRLSTGGSGCCWLPIIVAFWWLPGCACLPWAVKLWGWRPAEMPRTVSVKTGIGLSSWRRLSKESDLTVSATRRRAGGTWAEPPDARATTIATLRQACRRRFFSSRCGRAGKKG